MPKGLLTSRRYQKAMLRRDRRVGTTLFGLWLLLGVASLLVIRWLTAP
jgi:hypothetical protein